MGVTILASALLVFMTPAGVQATSGNWNSVTGKDMSGISEEMTVNRAETTIFSGFLLQMEVGSS